MGDLRVSNNLISEFLFSCCGRQDVKNSILFYPNERNSLLIRTLYIGSHVNCGPKN